ncbi:MAG: alcohol dehydrogenase catalytic domain-containing protein, partial [Bacteroidota bacterium]
MPPISFQALRITESADGHFSRQIIERTTDELPEGEVLIQVHYAALNYKDGLSASGHKGVTRKFPHTPGIDAAGLVAASSDQTFSEGDQVIVTGYDLGMNTDGGFGG